MSYPWGDSEDMNRMSEELNSSGFLITLLDIVTDEQWYVQLRELADEEPDVKDSLIVVLLQQVGEGTRNSREPMAMQTNAHPRRLLQVHWLPVRQEMISALRLQERKRIHDPDILEELRGIVEE
ncbi:hypothetical protein BC629DRAFT_1598939 [Irpex lacteus]|nr:hypothetical protein BC629DRAFT_1598939 [Irpex lacteus]